MHFACLCVCMCVCVFYICYCGVLLCFIFVWKLKGSIQSKEMNAMHCNATQVQCNTKCEAMCKYVDRCIRTYVSNPISKPSNIINILRIYWVGSPPDKSDKETVGAWNCMNIAWFACELWAPNFLICRVALDLVQTAGQLGLGSRHLSRSNDKMCVEIICLVYLDLIHLWTYGCFCSNLESMTNVKKNVDTYQFLSETRHHDCHQHDQSLFSHCLYSHFLISLIK